MANTTNFGWETPDDTDLVKDGALAMRTLGNAIDTSLVDLKGGTTGQNLRKNSNTDLDFTWAGDATNTVVDAAGDLLYGSAADTLTRLPIGTAGQVLKVNSGATAPEWGTLATSSFVGVSLTRSAVATSFTQDVITKIPFVTEEFDTDAFHDNSTNNTRITIPSGKGGKYLFVFNIYMPGVNGYASMIFYKNNAQVAGANAGSLVEVSSVVNGNDEGASASIITDAIAGDYFEIGCRSSWATGNKNITARFSAYYLGA